MAGVPQPSLENIGPSLAAGRLIGLDLGTTTIGVAVSDVTRKIASPLDTLPRTRFQLDAARLLELVAREKAVAIVIGLPINMDGSEGPRAQVDAGVCAKPRPALPGPHRLLGRAAVHGSGRSHAHRGGYVARQAGGDDRQARGGLHPPGSARSAVAY